MAATWVVLGHEGIKQYNELRKKAILKIIDQQRLQTDLLDSEKLSRGDFFHDGTKMSSIGMPCCAKPYAEPTT
jgi:hypothetical protein